MEANALELLTQRMVQFNEKLQDDATAVFNALNIIENMVEVDPKVNCTIVFVDCGSSSRSKFLPADDIHCML